MLPPSLQRDPSIQPLKPKNHICRVLQIVSIYVGVGRLYQCAQYGNPMFCCRPKYHQRILAQNYRGMVERSYS